MYYINWNNGLIDEFEGTIEEAKMYADENSAYTQCDISIEDENQEKILTRFWYGVQATEEDKEDEDIIEIGNGFYASWVEV